MLCDHCTDPIEPGEPYQEVPVHAPSAAAPNIVVHKRPCTPTVPHQSTQASISH